MFSLPKPSQEKVSVRRQMIFCLIPFLDIYAFYRIAKFRKYFVLSLLFAIPFVIANEILFPENIDDTLEEWWLSMFFIHKNIYYVVYSIFSTAVAILFAMYLVRRWSNQWNNNFP